MKRATGLLMVCLALVVLVAVQVFGLGRQAQIAEGHVASPESFPLTAVDPDPDRAQPQATRQRIEAGIESEQPRLTRGGELAMAEFYVERAEEEKALMDAEFTKAHETDDPFAHARGLRQMWMYQTMIECRNAMLAGRYDIAEPDASPPGLGGLTGMYTVNGERKMAKVYIAQTHVDMALLGRFQQDYQLALRRALEESTESFNALPLPERKRRFAEMDAYIQAGKDAEERVKADARRNREAGQPVNMSALQDEIERAGRATVPSTVPVPAHPNIRRNRETFTLRYVLH